jgi:hypothetical protein
VRRAGLIVVDLEPHPPVRRDDHDSGVIWNVDRGHRGTVAGRSDYTCGVDEPPETPKVIVADVAWTRIERDAETTDIRVLVGRSSDYMTPLVQVVLPQSTYEAVINSEDLPLAAKRKVYQLRAIATDLLLLLRAARDENP